MDGTRSTSPSRSHEPACRSRRPAPSLPHRCSSSRPPAPRPYGPPHLQEPTATAHPPTHQAPGPHHRHLPTLFLPGHPLPLQAHDPPAAPRLPARALPPGLRLDSQVLVMTVLWMGMGVAHQVVVWFHGGRAGRRRGLSGGRAGRPGRHVGQRRGRQERRPGTVASRRRGMHTAGCHGACACPYSYHR